MAGNPNTEKTSWRPHKVPVPPIRLDFLVIGAAVHEAKRVRHVDARDRFRDVGDLPRDKVGVVCFDLLHKRTRNLNVEQRVEICAFDAAAQDVSVCATAEKPLADDVFFAVGLS